MNRKMRSLLCAVMLVLAVGGCATSGKEQSYTLSVKWEPSRDLKGIIDINVTSNGEKVTGGASTVSPWKRDVRIKEGTKVHLSATQPTDGKLWCFIHAGKVQKATDHIIKAGSVNCWLNKKI